MEFFCTVLTFNTFLVKVLGFKIRGKHLSKKGGQREWQDGIGKKVY